MRYARLQSKNASRAVQTRKIVQRGTYCDTNEPIGRLTADELKMAARAFLTSRTDKKALDTIDMLLRERR